MSLDSLRILIVYNANGGLWGEAMYFLKKGLGIAKCELCTITHAGVKERPEWRSSKADLPGDVIGLHRNELTGAQRDFIAGAYPCVIAEQGAELTWILKPHQLSALQGDPRALTQAIQAHFE